jgi:hypothetical protein
MSVFFLSTPVFLLSSTSTTWLTMIQAGQQGQILWSSAALAAPCAPVPACVHVSCEACIEEYNAALPTPALVGVAAALLFCCSCCRLVVLYGNTPASVIRCCNAKTIAVLYGNTPCACVYGQAKSEHRCMYGCFQRLMVVCVQWAL